MPSPFPGMDPYLEAPSIWPDFHHALASEIRTRLNLAMPSPYYARLEMRQEVGIVDDDQPPRMRIIPDVSVVRRDRPSDPGGTAVVERSGRSVSESIDVTFETDPVSHHFVEIRDPSRGHRLVTLIEILSPSNKRNGPDRVAYGRKQAEILQSDASLVEIDLLRDGRRVSPHLGLDQFLASIRPATAYVVLVNSAWRRGELGLGYQVYPIGLREILPCVGIPLRAEQPVVPLDLQLLFDRIYDGGPYRRGAVDYTIPPEPPLTVDDAAWVEATLREAANPPAP